MHSVSMQLAMPSITSHVLRLFRYRAKNNWPPIETRVDHCNMVGEGSYGEVIQAHQIPHGGVVAGKGAGNLLCFLPISAFDCCGRRV